MNQTHLHLVVNHVSVIGSILGLLVLLYAMNRKSDETKNAAYYIFVISALGAILTYITGEAAEETVETIPGISKSLIESHEESAKFALISMIILGAASVIALWLTFKKSALSKHFSYVLFFLAVISFGITAYVANLGGKIRHTEIYGNTNAPTDRSSEIENND
jgi:uncharacterized membrane protein